MLRREELKVAEQSFRLFERANLKSLTKTLNGNGPKPA